MQRRIRMISAVTALALATACGSTRSSETAEPLFDGWLEASPSLQRQIDARVATIAYTQSLEEQVAIIQWFATVGEPAYETLLDLAQDPDPKVAGTAFAALGSTRDARLVSELREIPWPQDYDGDLALERARCLVQLGDWSRVGILVDGLRDERLYTRAVSAKALRQATREDFGFEPQGPPEERETAVERWQGWLTTRQTDPLLVPKSGG